MPLDNRNSSHLVRPSQGVRITIDRKLFPGKALMIPKTSDGRVLFSVPWYNKLLLGTTDTLKKYRNRT